METTATPTNAEAATLTNALERRLDLSVVIADLDKEIDQRLKRIGKNFKMPGFHPGKVFPISSSNNMATRRITKH